MEILKMSILSVTEGTALVELHLEECAAEFNCPGIAEREREMQCRFRCSAGPGIAETEVQCRCREVQVLQREREVQCMCGQDLVAHCTFNSSPLH